MDDAILYRTNLFFHATSELSQDAFFIWLCNWANKDYASIDAPLHNCAKDFIKNVLCKDNLGKCLLEEEIEIVETKRQHKYTEIIDARARSKYIDIIVVVNKKYLIVIEDKTHTCEHSGQLESYRKAAEDYCNNNNPKEYICIYLKTTYQSKSSLKGIIEKKWKPVMRKQLLEFFNSYKETLTNNIFIDFVSNLNRINDNIISFKTKDIKDWNDSNWIGFYEELEEEFEKRNLPLVVGWDYNSTPKGGFWGLYWNWVELENNTGAIYLQIEQGKLCIRLDVASIENNEEREKIRQEVTSIIGEKSNEDNHKHLNLSQHNLRKASSGYMTVGHTSEENWIGEGKFNMDKVIEKLSKYSHFIKECSK